MDVIAKAKQNVERLKAWGKRYGLNLAQALTLRELWREYHLQNENAINGKRHPRLHKKPWEPERSKREYAAEWEKDIQLTIRKMNQTAKEYGFEKVDYNPGLWPDLFWKGTQDNYVPA